MAFATSLYLWTLPVAAIPIVIHLLFRRRRRDVRWGSMYILRRVLETRSHVRAWLQYLVIALRTLALAALVMACAGLLGRRQPPAAESFPAPPAGTHRVVLLDTSASMAARHQTGTRLEAALGLVRRMVRAGRSPGRIDIVPLVPPGEVVECARFPVPDGRVEELLSGWAEPGGRADLEAGLRKAIEIFRGSPCDRRELFVLSDLAAHCLENQAEIETLLRKLTASGVATSCLRYGATPSTNFAVLDLTANTDVLLARQPALFRVRVGCLGSVPKADTVLTIEADALAGPGGVVSSVLREEPFTMTPGEKTLLLPLELPSGRHTITASVRGDDLPADDSLTRSYVVRPELRVLFVQDVTDARGFDDPRTWLELALSGDRDTPPSVGGEAAADADAKAADAAAAAYRILLEGKVPEQLNADLLRGADMVIVSGVGRMPAEAVAVLRSYAARGGMVLLAPQPGQKLADYNASYASLAPAAVGEPARRQIDPEQYESCLAEDETLPLWRELEAADQGNLANARFYNWFTVAPGSLAAESSVLLSLGDGMPLLVERRIGRGGVLLWTAGLGHDWHSLVVHPGFPVLLIRLAGLSAHRREHPVNLTVGQPLVMRTDAGQVKIVRPDGRSDLAATVLQGGGQFLRYERTDLPGVYDVREDVDSQQPGMLFTVAAADTTESDLRPPKAELEKRLQEAGGGKWFVTEAALAESVGAGYPGPSWWLMLAELMVVCLICEAAVSRWFLT